MLDRGQVEARISGYDRRLRDPGRRRRAAVLVPVTERGGALHLVFTLRPTTMPDHAGQVSFPGGRVEHADPTPWDTALRETHEELGVPEAAIERIGTLDDYLTVTNYHVVPCVGWLPPQVALSPSPREVERVFTVPLHQLLDPARRRTMRSPSMADRRVFFYLTEPEVVWGATGAMLTNLLEVLGGPSS